MFSSTLLSIAQKVIQSYLVDRRIQQFYDFDCLLHQLIMAAKPAQFPLPCTRIDLLFRNSQPVICEVNCDGSAGMRKDMVVNESLLSLSPYRDISLKYSLSYKNLISAQTKSYMKYGFPSVGNTSAPPVIAIVNFRDNNDFQENMLYVQEYKKHGITAILADPRDLVYYNGMLHFNGQQISFVQKEIDESDLLRYQKDCSDFIRAILDRPRCFIGSALGKIIDDKAFFALLHSGLANNILCSSEMDFVSRYIPLTHLFKGNDELLKLVKRNKNKYILKSRDTYGGVGVIAGKAVSATQWSSIIESTWNSNYIVQEFVETDTDMYPYIYDGSLKYDLFRITVGLFCYNGALSGFYSRASKEILINDYGPNDYYLANLHYDVLNE